ncbi:MAG: GAF domain-containing protein [Chloroflexota bacterium]|nr:GAF domain-containing protein [Chloroflexota bacterium]
MVSNRVSTPLRILLVEDSEHDWLAFRRAFQESHVPSDVRCCVRAEEALQLLGADHSSFDLVVADYKLPGMTGLELFQVLLERGVPLPLVLLTGAGTEHLAVDALKAGVDDYLIKDPDQGYLELLPLVLPEVVQKHGDRLARQRAEEALRRRNRELELLNRAGRALSSTLDLSRVLVTVLEEVRRLLDVVAVSVWLVDPETGELVCRQATGPKGEIVRGWRLAPGKGIAGWVARNGESLIVPDAQVDGRHIDDVDRRTGLGLRSIISVPLRVKQDVTGVLQVVDTEVDRFKPADLTLLELLAASASIAIENARLIESLRGYTIELQARNEELDAYAHTVAHDLKGPLGHIIGFADVLEEDYATLSEEELRQYLQTIAQGGHKISRIIDELLLLAGVRQMGEVEIGPLDMASIVAEVQKRLAYLIEEHQAEIILPEVWPVALGYGPWVEEVWANYLNNAVKYGGRPPRVELGATVQRDGKICFWVRDNGPGLTSEEQARLFKPFTRLDPKNGEGRAKGYGLGLSIVRRIVERLGEQVGVESRVGQGSVFTFTLPGAQVECPD